MTPFVTKGTRVYVKALIPHKAGTYSLAGVQPKVQAREIELTGTVAHVRGDAPVAEDCTFIGIWLVPDDPEATKLFDGLEVEAKRCPKCDRIEIGPIDHNRIEAVLT